jgi:hypothetical protein
MCNFFQQTSSTLMMNHGAVTQRWLFFSVIRCHHFCLVMQSKRVDEGGWYVLVELSVKPLFNFKRMVNCSLHCCYPLYCRPGRCMRCRQAMCPERQLWGQRGRRRVLLRSGSIWNRNISEHFGFRFGWDDESHWAAVQCCSTSPWIHVGKPATSRAVHLWPAAAVF